MSELQVRQPEASTPARSDITEEGVLAMVDAGRVELERAVASGDPAMVAQVAKRAEAIRYLSKKAGLALGAANAAARLKVDAERQAGAMLREAKEKSDWFPGAKLAPEYKDLNSGHPSRWEDMARVPDEQVQAYLKSREDKQAEITSAAIQHMGARLRRMENISEKQAAYEETPPDERPVSVVYADPPWRYDFAVSDSRKIENQYPTMDLADIVKVDPAPAEDAVLFLWATSPKLREGLEIMHAWGFTYKTSMVWVKPQIGMGYYARSQHELLLIGALGHLPLPEPQVRPSSVIDGRRTEHSAKPDLRPLLDQMYPGLWKREMFSRRPSEGLWLTHGNEVPG